MRRQHSLSAFHGPVRAALRIALAAVLLAAAAALASPGWTTFAEPAAAETPGPTATPTMPAATATPTSPPTATATLAPTNTATAVPTATATTVPAATATPTQPPTAAATATGVPAATSTPVPTAAPVPTLARPSGPYSHLMRLLARELEVMAGEQRQLELARQLSALLQAVVADLKAKGRNTSVLEAGLAEFNADLATCQSWYDIVKTDLDLRLGFDAAGQVVQGDLARATVRGAGRAERRFHQAMDHAMRDLAKAVEKWAGGSR